MALPKKLLRKNRVKKKHKQRGAISKEIYRFILRRDKRCVVCGSRVLLECHHIVPRSRCGEATPRNLVMLCKTCHHDKIHTKGDFKTKLKIFQYMVKLGYDYADDIEVLKFKHSQKIRRMKDEG